MHFKPSKKLRLSETQEVTINIRLMELNGEKLACPVRGKSLPLKIAKDADYKTLLESALKKRTNNDKTFDSECQYKLVYPDGQSAQTIPGCVQTFTVERYKKGLGKSYGQITLYLCPFFPLSGSAKAEDLDSMSSCDSDCDETTGSEVSGTIGGGLHVDTVSSAVAVPFDGCPSREMITVVEGNDDDSLPTHLLPEDPFSVTDLM